jgi:F-type H+-transporting ATPase subunit b
MKFRLALLLAALLLAAPVLPALAAAPENHEEHASQGAPTELVFKWINFIVIFGGGGYLAGGLLKRKFAEMRQGIQNQIADARRQREDSQQRLAEIEQRLSRLQQEIEAMRKEAAANAAAEKQRIRDAAAREAQRLLATTRAEIDSTARAARLELRAYAAHLAVTLAEQRIQQQLSPQVQAALFQAALGELPAPARPGGERRA